MYKRQVLVTSLVFLKEYEISAHIPLLVGGIFTAGIAIFKLGFTWKELEEGILSTINTTMPSIPVSYTHLPLGTYDEGIE